LAISGSGCALDRGKGFSTLESATLEVTLEPGQARDLGDGKVLTDLGYEVSVERARVRVESVQLQQVAEGGGGGSFDPSNPPAGYSLCHSGHCHRDDGALVDYEDIEVELAGGPEAFSPIVTLGFDEPISLLARRAVAASSYDPSRELDQSSPRRVLVTLSRLEIDGTISGAALGDDELALSVDLPLDTELDATLEGPELDRDGPERIELHTVVVVDGSLFDDIDFAAVAEEGVALFEDPDSASSRTLTASFQKSETSVLVISPHEARE
jgi:hypothetical protein